jgi:hypothetical protein
MFDNGPEPITNGLILILRNAIMGYANKFRQIITREYDYAKWFEKGKAEVTYNSEEYLDRDEHNRVGSKKWFFINKKRKKNKSDRV